MALDVAAPLMDSLPPNIEAPKVPSPSTQRFALGANYYALTFHPGGGGAEYPRQFDDKAYWVLQVGAEVYGDYYLTPWFLLRAAGSLYKDCADVWAGFGHFGFRLELGTCAGRRPAHRHRFQLPVAGELAGGGRTLSRRWVLRQACAGRSLPVGMDPVWRQYGSGMEITAGPGTFVQPGSGFSVCGYIFPGIKENLLNGARNG